MGLDLLKKPSIMFNFADIKAVKLKVTKDTKVSLSFVGWWLRLVVVS